MSAGEIDFGGLHEACSALYELTGRILSVPDMTDKNAILNEMQKLSEETVEKSRRLLYRAAKIAEGAPDRAREVYSLTDLATTAVLNAVNMVNASARMTALQEALSSMKKSDSDSVN